MSQWARNNPDRMEEIAALPLQEQAAALAAAADELAETARGFPPLEPKAAGPDVAEGEVHKPKDAPGV